MRILFLTADKYLYRKVELELLGTAELIKDPDEIHDVAIVDERAFRYDGSAKTIKLSDSASTELSLPLRRGAVTAAIFSSDSRARLKLLEGKKAVILDGEEIKLTGHEYALLSLLVSGKGNYVSRQDIGEKVWQKAGDGLINIYVHYLREKLERGDERVIISSRKLGYKINESFLEDKKC